MDLLIEVICHALGAAMTIGLVWFLVWIDDKTGD